MRFYPQTLDFTCGPAVLISALCNLQKRYEPSLDEEIEIWRQANTIFMGRGHAGSCVLGLAIEAQKRGLDAEVVFNSKDTPFLHSVRGVNRRAVVQITFDKFLTETAERGISTTRGDFSFDDVADRLDQGKLVIMLSKFVEGKKSEPHWVLAYERDGDRIRFWDPATAHTKEIGGQMHVVERDRFDRFSGYGRPKEKMMLALALAEESAANAEEKAAA